MFSRQRLFPPLSGINHKKRNLFMNTNIWILNHYASDMYFDHGGRHYNFAKNLRRAGYTPVIFSASRTAAMTVSCSASVR